MFFSKLTRSRKFKFKNGDTVMYVGKRRVYGESAYHGMIGFITELSYDSINNNYSLVLDCVTSSLFIRNAKNNSGLLPFLYAKFRGFSV